MLRTVFVVAIQRLIQRYFDAILEIECLAASSDTSIAQH